MVDITDRKQAQLSIEENERQLRLVTDSLPALICYIDRHRRYRFNNRSYEEWFGTPAEDYLGERIGNYKVVRPHVEIALRTVTEINLPSSGFCCLFRWHEAQRGIGSQHRREVYGSFARVG